MPKPTFEKIVSATLASTSTSFSVTSIPSTYTDLNIVFEAGVSTATSINMGLNGATSATNQFTVVQLFGDGGGIGTTASSENQKSMFFLYANETIGGRSFAIIDIFDYASNNKYKQALTKSNDQNHNRLYFQAHAWHEVTSAITSLVFWPQPVAGAGHFLSGTRVTVYGIKKG